MNMARKPYLGPASDPEMLILASLADGRKHGYAIMKDIESFSGNKVLPGTLYTAITRLVEKGWIEPQDVEHRQRPYRITRAGIRHLQGQLESMRRIASIGFRRLRFS
jgi:DNA-binding PadR family transcriptional regulator